LVQSFAVVPPATYSLPEPTKENGLRRLEPEFSDFYQERLTRLATRAAALMWPRAGLLAVLGTARMLTGMDRANPIPLPLRESSSQMPPIASFEGLALNSLD
jgi:hypothetical protein